MRNPGQKVFICSPASEFSLNVKHNKMVLLKTLKQISLCVEKPVSYNVMHVFSFTIYS